MGLDPPYIQAQNATDVIIFYIKLWEDNYWVFFFKIRIDLPNPKMLWLLENNPGLHELEKLVGVVTGVNPVFSPKDLFSLFTTSGKSFFAEKAALASATEFSGLDAFALSQLTTSLNFSWNIQNYKVNLFTPKLRALKQQHNSKLKMDM